MGLDTSHECWHGAYSAFMRWRRMIAKVAGLPPLDLMQGFYTEEGGLHNPFYKQHEYDKEHNFLHSESIWKSFPISWDCLRPSPLHKLLHHSDCEGHINWSDTKPIADALKKILPKIPADDAGGHIGNWKDKTQKFIDGLMAAHEAKERVEFH